MSLPGDFNSQLLYTQLINNGLQLERIPSTPFIEVYNRSSKKRGFLHETDSDASSFASSWIANDKFYTKQYLSHLNIPVAKGNVFLVTETHSALEYAKSLGYPVVAKPTNRSHGDFVYAPIDSPTELQEKLVLMKEEHAGNGYVLIEEFFPGIECRLFVTSDGYMASVLRTPAQIIGDGDQPIITLIQEENYTRMNPRSNCLCEIKLDDVLFDYLKKRGQSVNDIPKKGERVVLRSTSNVTKGGYCEDVTSKMHSSFKTLGIKILSFFPRLPMIGIDILCQDFTLPLRDQRFVVCELNASPGLSLHELPSSGKKRGVTKVAAKLISDHYA